MFQVRTTPNPSKIYTNQVVLERARKPDDSVEPPSEKIKSILEPPDSVLKAAEEMELKLKTFFKISEKSASQSKFKVPRASASTSSKASNIAK